MHYHSYHDQSKQVQTPRVNYEYLAACLTLQRIADRK